MAYKYSAADLACLNKLSWLYFLARTWWPAKSVHALTTCPEILCIGPKDSFLGRHSGLI